MSSDNMILINYCDGFTNLIEATKIRDELVMSGYPVGSVEVSTPRYADESENYLHYDNLKLLVVIDCPKNNMARAKVIEVLLAAARSGCKVLMYHDRSSFEQEPLRRAGIILKPHDDIRIPGRAACQITEALRATQPVSLPQKTKMPITSKQIHFGYTKAVAAF